MKKTKTAEKKSEAVVYCGPTIRGVAKSFTAYIGKLPDALKIASEECPAVKQLIVPASKLAETRMTLRIPTSPAAIFYRKIQIHFKGR